MPTKKIKDAVIEPKTVSVFDPHDELMNRLEASLIQVELAIDELRVSVAKHNCKNGTHIIRPKR